MNLNFHKCIYYNEQVHNLVFSDNFSSVLFFFIMTRCSGRTRDITLKAVVLELCPLLTETLPKLPIKYDNLKTIKDINMKL